MGLRLSEIEGRGIVNRVAELMMKRAAVDNVASGT